MTASTGWLTAEIEKLRSRGSTGAELFAALPDTALRTALGAVHGLRETMRITGGYDSYAEELDHLAAMQYVLRTELADRRAQR